MRTKVVALDHILEALTLYLRSLSIVDDNEFVVKFVDVGNGYIAVEIAKDK